MVRLFSLKESSKPFCFPNHLFQFTRLPEHLRIHLQWLSNGCLPLGALSDLFQIIVKLNFGFLYRGVYSIVVGLEDVTPEFAG